MKQHIWIVSFLLFFLNAFLFTSCEKDNEDLILGRWIFESARYTLTENEVLVTDSTTYEMGLVSLEFYDAGSMDIVYEDGENEAVDWRIEGDSLFIDLTEEYQSGLEIRVLDKEVLVLASTTGLGSGQVFEQEVSFLKEK